MNCFRFQRQTADWLGQKLSTERSQEMAAHQEKCVSCASIAQQEAQLRESWPHITAAKPAVDVWPRLVMRLEAPEPPKTRYPLPQFQRLPQWAMGGAAALAVMSVFCLHQISGERIATWVHPPQPAKITPLTPAEPALRQGASPALLALGDVAQNNPSVDDPVGATMEDVWANLKTSSKP